MSAGRPAPQSADYAATQVGVNYGKGHCLAFVVGCFDLSGQTPEAYAAAAYADVMYPGAGPPPRGVPLWWLGGGWTRLRNGQWVRAGHITVSDGKGGCYSTDFNDQGYVGDGKVHHLSDYRNIENHDNLLTYKGWSHDLEDVIVLSPESQVEADMLVLKDFVHPVSQGQQPPLYISLGNRKSPITYGQFQVLVAEIKVELKEVHKTGEPAYQLLNVPTVS